jgi:hypothetical protein
MRVKRLYLVGLLVLLAVPAVAQQFTATIRGAVTDPTGAVIASAKVTVKGEATGLTRTAATNSAGIYSFPDLPVGTYSVAIEFAGFRPATTTNIVLNVADVREVNVQMQTGPISEQVSVQSEGIGRGSTFAVRLPLADRPARTETALQPGGRVVRGLRILVADDSVDSALTLHALLSAAGHDVQAVHDGFAALQRAAEFRPHVMLLDIGMPGL